MKGHLWRSSSKYAKVAKISSFSLAVGYQPHLVRVAVRERREYHTQHGIEEEQPIHEGERWVGRGVGDPCHGWMEAAILEMMDFCLSVSSSPFSSSCLGLGPAWFCWLSASLLLPPYSMPPSSLTSPHPSTTYSTRASSSSHYLLTLRCLSDPSALLSSLLTLCTLCSLSASVRLFISALESGVSWKVDVVV